MPDWLPTALAAMGPIVGVLVAYLYGRKDAKAAHAQRPTQAPEDDGVRVARVVIEKELHAEVKKIKKAKKAKELAALANARRRD